MYYYAGNTTNNWVKFGGFYWRIIRTNADGGVRLLYSGTTHDTTGAYIDVSAFNLSYNSPMHAGYKYGTSSSLSNNRTNTNNSTIKGILDTWYQNNLNANYGKYMSTTAVYCNDRNLRSGDSYSTSSTFYYAAYARAYTSYIPTYDCMEATDAFSGSNSSAKLTYPIALMTVDEIMYAGGKSGTSLKSPYAWYYLNSANSSITNSTLWWLLSPSFWAGGNAYVFRIAGSGSPGGLFSTTVSKTDGVRPVISLKSCVKTSGGDGSATNPYTIQETTSGC